MIAVMHRQSKAALRTWVLRYTGAANPLRLAAQLGYSRVTCIPMHQANCVRDPKRTELPPHDRPPRSHSSAPRTPPDPYG